MKAFIGAGVAALALMLAGCGDKDGGKGSSGSGTPVAAVPAPNGDWTQVVSETPEGGYQMGNPNAPVKLVEYASLSCPHCAEFSAEAGAKLKDDLVKSGRMSWEFRPFLLFPTDPAVTLVARCQGPGAFFLLADQLYADQENWMANIRNQSAAQLQQIQSVPPQQAMPMIIKAAGLDHFFRMRGMPEAKLQACLADQKALDRLVEIRDRGSTEYEVQGTPTFFVNGKKVDGSTWQALEPELTAALGG